MSALTPRDQGRHVGFTRVQSKGEAALRDEIARLDAENQRLSEHNYRLYVAIREHRSDTMQPGGNPFGATPADERLWAVLDPT